LCTVKKYFAVRNFHFDRSVSQYHLSLRLIPGLFAAIKKYYYQY
jgi:hypothetical protein